MPSPPSDSETSNLRANSPAAPFDPRRAPPPARRPVAGRASTTPPRAPFVVPGPPDETGSMDVSRLAAAELAAHPPDVRGSAFPIDEPLVPSPPVPPVALGGPRMLADELEPSGSPPKNAHARWALGAIVIVAAGVVGALTARRLGEPPREPLDATKATAAATEPPPAEPPQPPTKAPRVAAAPSAPTVASAIAASAAPSIAAAASAPSAPPAVAGARLLLLCRPKCAWVTIDGVRQRAINSPLDVTAGTHLVVAGLPGVSPIASKISFKPGEYRIDRFDFAPAAATTP